MCEPAAVTAGGLGASAACCPAGPRSAGRTALRWSRAGDRARATRSAAAFLPTVSPQTTARCTAGTPGALRLQRSRAVSSEGRYRISSWSRPAPASCSSARARVSRRGRPGGRPRCRRSRPCRSRRGRSMASEIDGLVDQKVSGAWAPRETAQVTRGLGLKGEQALDNAAERSSAVLACLCLFASIDTPDARSGVGSSGRSRVGILRCAG